MKSTAIGRARTLRAAFVMEQALGHVTHYQNVRQFVDQQPDVAPTWLPIPFGVAGVERFVPMLRSNWSVRASWRARRALDAINASDTIDVAFFHSQVTSLFSTNLMRSVPSIISLDATPINYDSVGAQYGHRAAGDGFLDRKKYELNVRAFRAASGLVTWCDWARQSLVDDYGIEPGKIRVCAPGAPPAFFQIGEARGSMESHSDSSRRVRLLFVGGDFARKGGPLLLEAIQGPLGRHCQVDLVTQAALAPRSNVRVHRELKPNSPELRQLFLDADVFVLPTHADCLPVVLQEAAAAGLPVITTDVGAVRECVVQGESGWIIPPDDVQSLRSAIETIVNDSGQRVQMGRAARQLALRKFDATRNARGLIDYLHEAAEQRTAAPRAA